MSQGSLIIDRAKARGIFDEGTITDTSKPGTVMEIVPGSAFIGGRPQWRASSAADGTKRGIVVLLEDGLQGKLATDAYVANTRCFLYWPQPGEELNMLVTAGAGTGTSNDVDQGDFLGVGSTGKLKPDSSYATRPFQAMEDVSTIADALVNCKYLGPYA
jgi:hypothetical protein